jgi:peroxiredoxin
MAGTKTPRRAVFVLDDDRVVRHAWTTKKWIGPVPIDEIEAAINEL